MENRNSDCRQDQFDSIRNEADITKKLLYNTTIYSHTQPFVKIHHFMYGMNKYVALTFHEMN